jgi:GDPmannose 4,6-dehydratase
MSKRVLFFGISGQDGSYLSQLMMAKGYTVFGTSRDSEQSPFQNFPAIGIRERLTPPSALPADFRSVMQAVVQRMAKVERKQGG